MKTTYMNRGWTKIIRTEHIFWSFYWFISLKKVYNWFGFTQIIVFRFFLLIVVFTPMILQSFDFKHSSCIPCFFQSHENWGMTDWTFWHVSLLLVDLYISTVPHFKDKFTINNFFYHCEVFRSKVWLQYLKVQSPQHWKIFVTKTQKLGIDRKCILMYIFSYNWAR